MSNTNSRRQVVLLPAYVNMFILAAESCACLHMSVTDTLTCIMWLLPVWCLQVLGAAPLQMQGSWPQGMAPAAAGGGVGQGMPGSMMGQPLQHGSLMMGGMGMGAAAGPAGGMAMPMSHPQLLQQKLGGGAVGGGVPGAIGRSSSSGAQAAGGPGLQAWTAKEIGIVDKHDPAFDWMKGEFGKK
jgi:hypothetical protein